MFFHFGWTMGKELKGKNNHNFLIDFSVSHWPTWLQVVTDEATLVVETKVGHLALTSPGTMAQVVYGREFYNVDHVINLLYYEACFENMCT